MRRSQGLDMLSKAGGVLLIGLSLRPETSEQAWFKSASHDCYHSILLVLVREHFVPSGMVACFLRNGRRVIREKSVDVRSTSVD